MVIISRLHLDFEKVVDSISTASKRFLFLLFFPDSLHQTHRTFTLWCQWHQYVVIIAREAVWSWRNERFQFELSPPTASRDWEEDGAIGSEDQFQQATKGALIISRNAVMNSKGIRIATERRKNWQLTRVHASSRRRRLT